MKAGNKMTPIIVIDTGRKELFDKVYTEVEQVYNDYLPDECKAAPLKEIDFARITERILEERDADDEEFYIHVSVIEELTDEDDWSDVNNAIENIIKKYLLEEKCIECQ